jgi:hypothetical protein
MCQILKARSLWYTSKGHSVKFINPKLYDKWFKFDDEVVSLASKKGAINSNFGCTNKRFYTF